MILQFFDIVTTKILRDMGKLNELNPIAEWLWNRFGYYYASLGKIFFFMFLILSLLIIPKKIKDRKVWIIGYSIVYIYLVISSIVVFVNLLNIYIGVS